MFAETCGLDQIAAEVRKNIIQENVEFGAECVVVNAQTHVDVILP